MGFVNRAAARALGEAGLRADLAWRAGGSKRCGGEKEEGEGSTLGAHDRLPRPHDDLWAAEVRAVRRSLTISIPKLPRCFAVAPAPFGRGGRSAMEFDACGVYGGLWAFGGRFSGPGAYLSLTLGRTAWELAAEQSRSAVS